jgi:hypothetical protein
MFIYYSIINRKAGIKNGFLGIWDMGRNASIWITKRCAVTSQLI